MTELETSATNAGRNIREQLETDYWGGSSATTAYINALNNFQDKYLQLMKKYSQDLL